MESGSGRTRRSFLARGALLALGAAAGPLARPFDDAFAAPGAGAEAPVAAVGGHALANSSVVPGPPLRNADYWEFAGWLQPAMDRLWNEGDGAYTTDTRINACALMTHSIAALEGNDGPGEAGRARQTAGGAPVRGAAVQAALATAGRRATPIRAPRASAMLPAG